MTDTKTFSFKEEYKKEYLYVCELRNASEYICNLIREDLKKRKPFTPEEISSELDKLADELHSIIIDRTLSLNKKDLFQETLKSCNKSSESHVR